MIRSWEKEREKLIGRKPHCDQDYGGSHYHCAKCNGVSSMMGHYTTGFRNDGRWVTFPDHAGYFTCQPEFELAKDAVLA